MKISHPNATLAAPGIEEITLQMTPSSSSGEPAKLSLSCLTGRVIVLFVFGIDCGTCKHLAALLSDFRGEFTPEVEFIGICVQSGCEEKLEAFRAECGTELRLSHCSTRELCLALHIRPATWLFYPTLIFIDDKQRMRGYFVGGDSFFEDTPTNLRRTLEELLNKQRGDEALDANEKVEAGV